MAYIVLYINLAIPQLDLSLERLYYNKSVESDNYYYFFNIKPSNICRLCRF